MANVITEFEPNERVDKKIVITGAKPPPRDPECVRGGSPGNNDKMG